MRRPTAAVWRWTCLFACVGWFLWRCALATLDAVHFVRGGGVVAVGGVVCDWFLTFVFLLTGWDWI